MPTVPTYPVELPEGLNLLNPKHYLLVAYWVFFRPTALKCYLYQADPEIYRQGPGFREFVNGLKQPAYWRLCVIAIGVALLLSIVVGVPIVSVASAWQGSTPDWPGVAFGVAFGVAVGVGSFRLPVYLIEGSGVWRLAKNNRHPLWWDELTVLPFINVNQVIAQVCNAGEVISLHQWSQVAANPFQRWILQRGLYRQLHRAPVQLPFLYQIFLDPALDAYAIAPLQKPDWRNFLSVRQVFVSELAGCGNVHARGLEGLVWQLTKFRRINKPTPLTEFAHLIYQLVWGQYADETLPADFDLGQYRLVYGRLIDYPGGQEIQQSFDCMAQYLSYPDVANLAQANDCLEGLPIANDAIRPSVIHALQQFGQIGQDVAIFQAATSRVNQLASLARATDALEELRAYINGTVLSPEQKILQAIVRRWRELIADKSGELGQLTIAEPIPNPYVAGNPVSGELFVGREEILRELEELWLQPGQTDSVLLYGHRRMGKSSILKNLPQRLDARRNWVVEFNLQRVGKVRSTGELLYALALEMFDRLPPDENLPVKEPDEAPFLDAQRNPSQAFNRWLKQVAPHMGERRFIIAIDEFELIEVAIDDQRLDADLIEYLRGLINTTDWFVIALAGLYTLQEKTHDYWNPLFGSIKPRKVSFLSPTSTSRLLTQPSPDFPIDYTQDTLDEIVWLTSGQPYLVQLIGQNLVAQFNHQVFEAGQDSNRPIALADLRAVIDSPEFFQDGGAYFTGVWRQAEDSDPPRQPEILTALCEQQRSIPELAAATGLDLEQVAAAIQTLTSHDVIHATESGHYTFTVELMRRWVQQRQAGYG